MTVCNMSIEARRARRPDRAGRDDLRLSEGPADGAQGRGLGAGASPTGGRCRPIRARITTRRSCSTPREIIPQVTWGTSPEDVLPITGIVPDPGAISPTSRSAQSMRALARLYGPDAGHAADRGAGRARLHRLLHQRPDRGSARRRRDRQGPQGRGRRQRAWSCRARAWSKHQAEEEGLDRIFIEAGFEWREPGCSMCLAMNPDKLEPGERCASTSNRNFEGRQGRGGRTHLMSPAHGRGRGDHRPSRRRARFSVARFPVSASLRRKLPPGLILRPGTTGDAPFIQHVHEASIRGAPAGIYSRAELESWASALHMDRYIWAMNFNSERFLLAERRQAKAAGLLASAPGARTRSWGSISIPPGRVAAWRAR